MKNKRLLSKIVVSSMILATTLGVTGKSTFANSQTEVNPSQTTTVAQVDYKVTEGKLLMELDSAGKTVTRTMIPLRGAFAELGFQVSWDENTQQATLKNGKYTVVVTKDKKEYTVNGKKFVSDVVPPLLNGRFYVPLRSIGDNVGATTSWDNQTKRATIVLDGKGVYVQIGDGVIDNRPKTTKTTKPSTKGGSSSGGNSNNDAAGTTIIEGYDPFGGDLDTSYGGAGSGGIVASDLGW